MIATLKIKPDLGPAYGDLATAASENKNYELAIKALDARAKFLPEIPVGYFLRATAYDHLRDFKNAAVNYHLFLDSAKGQYPDQEWQARHRLIAIEPEEIAMRISTPFSCSCCAWLRAFLRWRATRRRSNNSRREWMPRIPTRKLSIT